ncbi:MAG: deoxyribose-phosphate aldolase [Oscillospiraceae bacterium]|nr:deoxyribose-phosphate aldolase [Oscillospiraceae bacterium]
MTKREVAQMIDISAVRTHHGLADIEEIVSYAKEYSFINVHVLPNWISTLAPMIKDVPDVYVGSPCGFPSGGHSTEVKLCEARQMIADGVQEMDIVMNVGRFKSGQYDYVLNEVKQIVALKKDYMKTKILIELNCLTNDELPKACEIVMESGADFLKTGTGWVPGNANIERIRKIKKIVGNNVKIKAAGGIRTREEFDRLYDIGVERFGINTQSAIEILKTFD